MKKILSIVLTLVMLAACASVKDESGETYGEITNSETTAETSPDISETTATETVSETAETIPVDVIETPDTVGNSYGNIVNGGFAAYNDGWIYYCNEKTDNCFYKMRGDGTEKTKLAYHYASYINIVDGWIYYCYDNTYHDENYKWYYVTDECGIFRMRTDGSENERIAGDITSRFMCVSDGWIYYAWYGIENDPEAKVVSKNEEKSGIYKIRLDGSERTRVTDADAYNINIDGDWIYYTVGMGGDLYKVRVDGTEKTLLRSMDDVYFCESIIAAGDWIYYICETFDDSFPIYKIRTDGAENTLVISGDDNYGINFNIADGWIYYAGWYEEEFIHPIYKTRLDGSVTMRLGEYSAYEMNIVGDWIIYEVYSDDPYYYEGLYKMRLDGTDNQLLD